MIPLLRPFFPPVRDIERIYRKAFKTGKHSNFGPLFEDASVFLSEKANGFCLPVSTGTAAIEIACRMKFKQGDRILVPDYTHIGTLVAIKAAGCTPVLSRTNEHWVLDPNDIQGKQINGVVAVSPFGYSVNTKAIDRICKRLDIGVVYDFAGAWGYFPKTKNPVCYSLHATKNFACGEGGVIRLRTQKEWIHARWLSNFCNDKDRIVRNLDGRNHKPSELLCAVILAYDKHYKVIADKIKLKSDAITFYKYHLNLKTPEVVAPSMCVLGHFLPTLKQGKYIEMKQYYTPFPNNLCDHISRTDLSLVTSRHALPSDVTAKEANEVVGALLYA